MCIYIYLYLYIYVYICVCVCVCACVCVCVLVCIWFVPPLICVCVVLSLAVKHLSSTTHHDLNQLPRNYFYYTGGAAFIYQEKAVV